MAGDAPQENFSFVTKKKKKTKIKNTNNKFTLHYEAFVETFRYFTQTNQPTEKDNNSSARSL